MGITGGKAASASLSIVVNSVLPEDEVSLFSGSGSLVTDSFTIPSGVTCVYVTSEAMSSPNPSFKDASFATSESGVSWGTLKITRTEMWASIVYIYNGSSYVRVTPGKTYTITYIGNISITYSKSINEQTPDVIDL